MASYAQQCKPATVDLFKSTKSAFSEFVNILHKWIGYPELLALQKIDAVRQISDAVSRKSTDTVVAADISPAPYAVHGISVAEIGYAVRSQSWVPGQLHLNLSWNHYIILLSLQTE